MSLLNPFTQPPMLLPQDPAFNPMRRRVAEVGPYSVYHDPLVHLPWGLYRVYRQQTYIGAQLSHPSQSDCRMLERPATATITRSRGFSDKLRGIAASRKRAA